LRAAKSFIDCPPKLITGGLLLEDAEKLQKQFSDLGNTVVIEEER
jgi:ribosomal protein L7/L12